MFDNGGLYRPTGAYAEAAAATSVEQAKEAA
jgi:hypothetical protein